MFRRVILILAVLTAASSLAWAEQKPSLGLGIIIGEPTGLSLKQWLDEKSAIDAAIAWSSDDAARFQLHADYLLHKPGGLKLNEINLPLYYGVGGRFRANDKKHDWLGVRIPVGLIYNMKQTPIEFFGEIVPIMDLVPGTELRINVGLGARYYF